MRINTDDLLLNGVPLGVSLVGLQTQQGVRLVVQNEEQSHFVRDGYSLMPALLKDEQLTDFLKAVPQLEQLEIVLCGTRAYQLQRGM